MNICKHLQKNSGNAAWRSQGAGFLLAIGLGLLGPSVAAQGLPDPTRPPSGFVDSADGVGSGGAEAGMPPVTTPDPEAGLILQSVLLPKTGKPVAVIGGRYVPLGGNVDGWELVRVNEREAVVARGAERRTLKMTPLVTKTPVVAATSVPKTTTPKKSVKPVKKSSKSKPTKVSCNDEIKPK